MTIPVADGPADTAERERMPPLRRLLLVLAFVAAIGLFVVAGRAMDTGDSNEVSVSGDIVERLVPAEDDEVLAQSRVALDLAPGWGVQSLAINGTDVPEAEWEVTASLGLYEFLPTGGLSVESLQTNENCVSATIFRLADLTNTRVVSWCFTAF